MMRPACRISSYFWLLLAALALLPLSPGNSHGSPPGGGSVSLFNRYTDQKTSAARSAATNESLLRLDLYQSVPGYGRLFSSTDLTRTDFQLTGETTSLSRYQMGLEGFRLGGWTSSVIAGDTSVRFTNLVDGFPGPFPSLLAVKPFLNSPFAPEPGRFLNTNYPDISFRGGLLNSVTERDSLLFFGGRLATPRGFQANDLDLTDESLYGFKWAHRVSDKLYGGIGILQTRAQPREGSPGAATLNNTIILLDGSYRVNSRLKLVGEFKENLFRLEGRSFNDRAFKAGPVLTLPNATLELNYRRVGPDFLFVSENLQPERDLEGIFASAEYRPFESLTIYSSLDWNRSNLANSALLPAVDSISALAGAYLFRPGLPSFNVRFSVVDRSSWAAGSSPVDNRSFTANLEAVKQYKFVSPYLRLQADLTGDSITPESSSKSGTIVAGARVFPSSLLNFYLEGEEQIRNADNGSTTASFKARGGIFMTPDSRLGLHSDVEYAALRDDPAGTAQESISASCGVSVSLPGRFFLTGDIRYTLNRSGGAVAADASALQITAGITRQFGWGTPGVAPLPGQPMGLLQSEVGNIDGYVFQDLNRNGSREAQEPGMSGVTVLLEDNSRAVTNAEGRYVFRNVPAGVHQVRINERELPADLNLLASPSRRVEVAIRQTEQVQFPLLRSGTVKGRVMIDSNGDGVAGQGDAPLPDILIYLAGTPINTFTDGDGNFSMENLMPGQYEVKIDRSGLTEAMKLDTPDTYAVEIKSGEETGNLIFLVTMEKREVIKKIFGQDSQKEQKQR